jgi:hypothetical protein
VRKNAVFVPKIDVFLPKNDEICRKCFALYLPQRFCKLHILNINRRAPIEKTLIFEGVFYFSDRRVPGKAENGRKTNVPTPLCANCG